MRAAAGVMAIARQPSSSQRLQGADATVARRLGPVIRASSASRLMAETFKFIDD
jgi:hypothetical protein